MDALLIALVGLSAATAVTAAVLLRRAREQTLAAERATHELEAASRRAADEAGMVRARHTALMDLMDCAVLVVEADDIVSEANDLGWRLLGSAPGSRSVSVRAALLDGLVDAVRQARIGVPVRQVDLCGQVRSDTSAVASAVRLGGAESPVLLVVRDITEVKRLETVRQDFVANVSHELRTPLASIRALAETLEDGAMGDPSVAPRFLGNIISETQRLTRIADDLLALTEAETRPVTEAEVALDELILRVTQKLAPQADATGQTLDVEVEPGLRVAGNADRLEQVLINLIDNAMKYTQPGGRLAVRAGQQGQIVRIDVSDTGIGLMQHELERIFERFYRVDKARSRQSGGTGLGLSIVRRIVEAHGGTVTVTSELHKGSTFTVSLPALAAPDEPRASVTPAAHAQVL